MLCSWTKLKRKRGLTFSPDSRNYIIGGHAVERFAERSGKRVINRADGVYQILNSIEEGSVHHMDCHRGKRMLVNKKDGLVYPCYIRETDGKYVVSTTLIMGM